MRVMWRAHRKRHDELCFLTWLESTDLYRPTVEAGKPVAPKRCRSDYEADAAGWASL